MSQKLIMLLVCFIATTTFVFGQQKDLSKNDSATSISRTLEDVIITANKIEQKQNSTGK
jgi:hypothetical protein